MDGMSATGFVRGEPAEQTNCNRRTEQAREAPFPTRRGFLKYAGAAAVGTALAGVGGCTIGRPRARSSPVFLPKREKLRVAYIGVGGRGEFHVAEGKNHGVECPCFCDVDTTRMGQATEFFPTARRYQDYREMFEREADNFDAVSIAAPDHHHYPATMLALQLGKHVYCEKPLTHTVWEARRLTEVAAELAGKVITQMGIQGHAGAGWRRFYAWYHSGALGDIIETHTWSDRPIWPQGIGRPEGADPVPSHLDWDAWLGPAPQRPYKAPPPDEQRGPYHDFNWRGWWDFGTGALGDMGCHCLDVIFATLDPGWPTAVEPVAFTPLNDESFPRASIIKWEFPARHGRPAFTSYWYDGELRPRTPATMALDHNLPQTGSLLVGTRASLAVTSWDSVGARFIPEELNKQIGPAPKDLLPESSPGHVAEWLMACRGEKPADYARANFLYAGPMTQCVLLGNLALRLGRRIEWDAANMQVANVPEANAYLTKEYREGWRV